MKKLRVDKQIRVPKVNLIDEEGKHLGLIETTKALEMALRRGLNLVEVDPKSSPPVCRILDYGKYLYKKEKEIQKQKKKTKIGKTKSIRLSLRISPHDLQIKIRKAHRFLEAQNKVKIILILKGREFSHLDRGKKLISEFTSSLEDISKEEEPLKIERNILSLTLEPLKSPRESPR